MTLRFGNFSIVASTDKGPFGCSHTFEVGLNILRANNSAGKSTVLRGLIYALGLEGMFSPSHDVPLPHVVTEYIDLPGGNASVRESHVSVEIWNENGKALTISRSITGDRDTHLISVREGQGLSDPKNAGPASDYFVRTPRGMQSDRGFHSLLANFIGWNLPEVGTFEGGMVPLYMELLFPLISVEQKLGWGRIPARFPTWLGVKDVRRRTIEFLLKLDAYAIAEERLAIQMESVRIRNSWSEIRATAGKRAISEGAILNAVPQEPQSTWPPQTAPEMYIGAQQSGWEALPKYVGRLKQKQKDLKNIPVASSGANDSQARSTLADAENAISEREQVLRQILQNLEGELSEAEALEERIASLIEDQRKYKDLRKLRDLGSDGVDEVIHGSCPTCHQDISDSLMDLGQRSVTMSVDQNIAFYDEQLQLSRAVLENARKSITASEAEVVGIRSELDRLRSEVRSLRETLTATSNTPSIEALTERLRLDQRVERLEELIGFFKEMMAAFANLADDWDTLQERIKRLPKGALSKEDDAKLQALQNSLQLQLRSYGFRSVGSELVTVSRDYYEPELSDMNLAADAAASDVIRLQWAYLIGLLEISRQFGGNHLSLLIMDEPQQQSVEDKDFFHMLHHMAEMKNVQIIVGTSHDAAGVAAFTAANKSIHSWELGDDHLINPIK